MRTALVVALAFVACTAAAPRESGSPPHALAGSDRHDPGCGDGFCDNGETHDSCPSDCCELGADGACAARCGNGFCETGETPANCPQDC